MNRDYIWRHIWSELELKCFIHLCKASFSDFPLEGGENSATDRENRSFGTTYEPYRSVNRCSEYRSRESSPTLYNCARQTSSSRHENYNFQFHEYRDERMRSRMRARNVSGARDVKKAARWWEKRPWTRSNFIRAHVGSAYLILSSMEEGWSARTREPAIYVISTCGSCITLKWNSIRAANYE